MKTKTPRPRRESHASIMLGLAKTEYARLLAKIPPEGTSDAEMRRWHNSSKVIELRSKLIKARSQVEHWQKTLADESLPLVRK